MNMITSVIQWTTVDAIALIVDLAIAVETVERYRSTNHNNSRRQHVEPDRLASKAEREHIFCSVVIFGHPAFEQAEATAMKTCEIQRRDKHHKYTSKQSTRSISNKHRSSKQASRQRKRSTIHSNSRNNKRSRSQHASKSKTHCTCYTKW